MNVAEMIDALELSPLHLADEGTAPVKSVYCGDLLSDVLAHAEPDSVWFTVQGHNNIIAIAALRDLACVVVANGVAPDPQTVANARNQGISLCGSSLDSAALCQQLAGRL